MKKRRNGVISVVLVNFRGADDTIECVRGLRELNWPADRLEIVVVENGSGDDSLEKLKALGDDIVLIDSGANLGFTGGCNLGVEHSSGEFVAFLTAQGGEVRNLPVRHQVYLKRPACCERHKSAEVLSLEHHTAAVVPLRLEDG